MSTIKAMVAGVQFRGPSAQEVIKTELTEGYELDLVPEPENKFDPNAVAICWSDREADKSVQIGYVPKKYSAEVSAAISFGLEAECIVNKLNAAGKPWEQVEVLIQMEDFE